MRGISAIKRTLRGEVRTSTAALEAVRRMNSALLRRRERAQLEQLNRQPARLMPEFARMSHAELLAHFRERESPKFFPGFVDVTNTARLQREIFPEETQRLLVQAARIAKDHCWSLLGFGEKCFGADEIDWNRDPLSGYEWLLDYHADINLFRADGSDARVLWELNRLSHLITLARAYTLTENEALATEFLRQVRSWRAQNPVGRGANWACAMEVALRAMNLLAAFSLFVPSAQIDEDALAELLMIFDQHGAHIRRNLEYSHIATSNHYMCDVAGLLWLGVMLPELQDAAEWREFSLRELLNEVDKQILTDGADSESSTGYHRLKLELLLYSFVLCRENEIEIEQKYWQKLRAMADYTRAYLRPDGRASLIGDSDSGQILPVVKRAAADHAYVLGLAAAALDEAELKVSPAPREEVLWLLGEQGMRAFHSLPVAAPVKSRAFADASIYVFPWDAKTGTMKKEVQVATSLPKGFDGKPWAADIHLTPDGKYLYASERTSSTLAAFKVDAKTGMLTPIDSFATEKQPRAFNIDPTGSYLYAANQGTNNIWAFQIDQASGLLSPLGEIKTGTPVDIIFAV